MVRRTPWAILLLLSLLVGCTSSEAPVDPARDEGSASFAPNEEPAQVEKEVSPSERPHAHDYWEGASSVTLLDENVQVMIAHNHLFDEPPREQHTHGCDETLASESQGGSRKFSLPDGIIVLPGTGKLSFLVDWTMPSVTGLRLLYRPAGQHDLVDAGLVTSGTPLDIVLTPAMADAGHATRTSWVFFLCADGSAPANVAEGSVHVDLMAIRADEIPIEPPHPDRWGDRTQLELVNVTQTTTALTALNKGDGAWIHIPLEHDQIVPPGTERILAHLTITDRAPTASALPVRPILYYRDSTVPEWIYKTANLTEREFHIDVDHNMVDGVYAHESSWDFWLRLSSEQTSQTPAGRMSEPRYFDGTVTIHLVAQRDIP